MADTPNVVNTYHIEWDLVEFCWRVVRTKYSRRGSITQKTLTPEFAEREEAAQYIEKLNRDALALRGRAHA